jgi:hypothetical protein
LSGLSFPLHPESYREAEDDGTACCDAKIGKTEEIYKIVTFGDSKSPPLKGAEHQKMIRWIISGARLQGKGNINKE